MRRWRIKRWERSKRSKVRSLRRRRWCHPPRKRGGWRMVYEDCELGESKKRGRCAIKGCKKKSFHGCKAHDVRLCFPKCLDRFYTDSFR